MKLIMHNELHNWLILYYGHYKFIIVKCDWFKDGEDKYRLSYNDPFILSYQVHQMEAFRSSRNMKFEIEFHRFC